MKEKLKKVRLYMRSGNSILVEVKDLEWSGNTFRWTCGKGQEKNRLLDIAPDQIEAIVRES